MSDLVVLSATGTHTVAATTTDGTVRVPVTALEPVLGWHAEAHGLCRGDMCVPHAPATRPGADGTVDLVAVCDLLGRPVVADLDAGAVAIGVERDVRHGALRDLTLPAFTLPDLDGHPVSSTAWRDRKTLLLAFSSW